jgi:hypothetical protein
MTPVMKMNSEDRLMTTLRQFVEQVAQNVSRIFEKQGQVLPMYHIIDAEGRDFVMLAPPLPDKDMAVAVARALLAEMGATRVAYIDEGWALDSKLSTADIQEVYRSGVSISEHPDRIEVILINAEDAIEGAAFAMRKIIRQGDSAVLGELEISEGGKSEGRMVGLLPTPGTKH